MIIDKKYDTMVPTLKCLVILVMSPKKVRYNLYIQQHTYMINKNNILL